MEYMHGLEINQINCLSIIGFKKEKVTCGFKTSSSPSLMTTPSSCRGSLVLAKLCAFTCFLKSDMHVCVCVCVCVSVCLCLCVCAAAAAKSLQSCPTLCDPIDRSPPGSTVPGILQARTLEWVAISFSNA